MLIICNLRRACFSKAGYCTLTTGYRLSSNEHMSVRIHALKQKIHALTHVALCSPYSQSHPSTHIPHWLTLNSQATDMANPLRGWIGSPSRPLLATRLPPQTGWWWWWQQKRSSSSSVQRQGEHVRYVSVGLDVCACMHVCVCVYVCFRACPHPRMCVYVCARVCLCVC